MAEIGLIASVVGVTGAALAASKALSDMIDQIRNAPEEILAISKDTHSFHDIITNVQVAITDQFIVSKLATEQQILRAVRQLEGPLKNCGTILTQMRSRIKSHLKQSGDGGFRVSNFDMRWIFQRKDVMDCRNRLETTKSTLNAALSSVVFLCHMKMMGSLRHDPDVLPISGLDLDAGSALRDYAESIASRSPPLDATFESAARHAEQPAQGLSISKQPSQEDFRSLKSDTPMTADKPRTPSEIPNNHLRTITPNYAKAASFRSAIDARDISKIELMLAENYDANITAADGWTALHVAVEYGRIDIVQLLIERNADVKCKRSDGWTPIDQAAYIGHEDVLRVLLNAKNIDVNATAHDGWTPLHLVASEGHEKLVQILINSKDINVNARNKSRSTSLHKAAGEGHEKIARMLLDSKNMDVNAKDINNWTPFHRATYFHPENISQILSRMKDIEFNDKRSKDWTPLHRAAYSGHENIVQTLLSVKDIDVNATTTSFRWTPLQLAASQCHEKIVQMLLNSRKINVNAKDLAHMTPLHHATCLGGGKIVQTLLSVKEIEINAENLEDWTPLHVAAQLGHENIVQSLLSVKNIDVNAKNLEKRTPLHLAVQEGHENIAKMLLDSNADICAETMHSHTALIEAICAKQEDTAILLIQRGSPLLRDGGSHSSPLYCACNYQCHRVVKALIETGKSSGQTQAMLETDYDGYRPLHVAAFNGSLEIASQIIEAGADINVRDANQRTPLLHAGRAGQLQMMDYLLQHGADPAAKDDEGRDVLRF